MVSLFKKKKIPLDVSKLDDIKLGMLNISRRRVGFGVWRIGRERLSSYYHLCTGDGRSKWSYTSLFIKGFFSGFLGRGTFFFPSFEETRPSGLRVVSQKHHEKNNLRLMSSIPFCNEWD